MYANMRKTHDVRLSNNVIAVAPTNFLI